MKEGVIVRVTRKTELGDTCGIVREMVILGGKRIVEGTGNFRRIGNCAGGGEKIKFLKSYTIMGLLHNCISPSKRIKIP